MEENKRQFKGIWIPAEIWLNRNLSWNEKILLAEIDSFSSRDKDFYMSNEYIANFLGVTETSANKILSSLIKKGFVIKTKFDGRKRWVKSALSSNASQGCSQEQGSIADGDNIDNKNRKQEIKKVFGVDKSTPEGSSQKSNFNESSICDTKDLEKSIPEEKSSKEKVAPWRESFDEYMKLVNEGAAALMADAKFRAEVEQLQPNVDYDRTIKWCVSQYWGTETGWEKKRRSKTKKIDMKMTLRNSFNMNRIYKERETSLRNRKEETSYNNMSKW